MTLFTCAVITGVNDYIKNLVGTAYPAVDLSRCHQEECPS